MYRIAFIGDIHSNLTALEATFEDISQRNVDCIICVGDIIGGGKHSSECISLVRQNCDFVIQGNHEEGLGTVYDTSGLSKGEIEYLTNLPFSKDFFISGRRVRVFHSTPESAYDFITQYDDRDVIRKMFEPSKRTQLIMPDMVVCAHVHTPYKLGLYNRVIVGIGSVGASVELSRNPLYDGDSRETTCANYTIISGENVACNLSDTNSDVEAKKRYSTISVEQVSVPYDIEKELLGEQSEDRCKCLRMGIYPDMDKIDKFYRKNRGKSIFD